MTRKKLLLVGTIIAAVLGVGTGVVLASAGDDDEPLRGTRYDRATEAALDHVGGGEVIETEAGDDGAAYSVEIRTGESVVEVDLDEDFDVIGSEEDEDGPNDSEDGPNDDD